ncbi:RHS repeat-associated core domain-containing protein [Chryseobacterium sp. Marseille-Q3244]|uniref:RHS repeat-associated core domain-containing protein n=1 Tax=Chryseobacterium sp. Marseille-Q3244 TaxID=2758092 RepID=UPI0020254D25|nr:RHS repeat-associated core domain-containing protein [Chryseobacterium sp. Marseille-Q3244]
MQHKDHLGNTRINFAKNNAGVLEITDTNNYYPFGLNHISGMFGTSNFGGLYSYKYNGKELQETGMYDYGARFYMPDLGRWGVMDQLAEKMTRHNPYNYAFNNPLRFIDPDGREATDIFKWDNLGKLTKVADSNTDVIYAENQFEGDGKTLKADAKGVEVGEKGYIEANRQEITLSETFTDRQGKSSNTLTTLSFHNNPAKATEVAEYMYNNGTSEFSNSTYASSKGGFSVVSTLGLPSKTFVDPKQYMQNFNINGDSFYPSVLTNHDHNHPSNYLPSGYMFNVKDNIYIPRKSDVEGARGNMDYHNTVDPDFKNVKFRTYLKGKYMNYNSKSAYYD